MAKLTNSSTIGTSYFDIIIKTSVQELSEKLGKPQWKQNDGKDKVNFQWDCETKDGHLFTIYDHKEYRKISKTELIDFHIGGLSEYNCRIALQELKQLLS